MFSVVNQLLLEIQHTSFLEFLAFIFSILYLLLASKEIIWCWIFAILSSVLYIFIFFQVNLYTDSVLNFFYAIMGIAGWLNWNNKNKRKITYWKARFHVFTILLNLIFASLLGFLLHKFTDQAYPYIDSFIFIFSISATILTIKKIIENWIYFIVIDIVAIFVYWNRNLYLTSLLFFIYTILAIFAYFSWLTELKTRNENSFCRS